MGKIDVSELMTDPDFTDMVTITHRAQTISDYGETVLTPTTQSITAIVQAGNGETLKRNPEYSVMEDWITIYSTIHFVSDGGGKYTDQILWNGRTYNVKSVVDFSNWGNGYTRADCLIEGAQ